MCEGDKTSNGESLVRVRRSSLLRHMRVALRWSVAALAVAFALGLAAPAGATGVAPDPSPDLGLQPDPYPSAAAAPRAPSNASRPVTRIVTAATAAPVTQPAANRPATTGRPPTGDAAARHRPAPAHRAPSAPHTLRRVPLPTLGLTRFGAVIAGPAAAAAERISAEVALALAAFVLLSGAFVATATRAVFR